MMSSDSCSVLKVLMYTFYICFTRFIYKYFWCCGAFNARQKFLTFCSTNHLELIFVYGVGKELKFILLHTDTRFSQQYILKQLVFLPWISHHPARIQLTILYCNWVISRLSEAIVNGIVFLISFSDCSLLVSENITDFYIDLVSCYHANLFY